MRASSVITAAVDGSALGNPGPAGWAWYIDSATWACGGWKQGTNNMGELMAVLDLLKQTQNCGQPVLVLCDSQYVVNICTKWRFGWKRRGWKKADGSPILNLDLIKELDSLLEQRQVEFQWVKGHDGHELNEIADSLARNAATAFKEGKIPDSGPGFSQAGGLGKDVDSGPCAVVPQVTEQLVQRPDVDDLWQLEQSLQAEDLVPVTARKLGPDAYLLTWRFKYPGTAAQKRPNSVVWVRTDGQWNLRFVRDRAVE